MKEKLKNNWLAILAAVVSTGLAGQVLGVWNLSIEREDDYITKYVQCKEMIAEIEARLNTLEMAQSEIPFPYWVKDKDLNIIHVSNVFAERILYPLGLFKVDIINTDGSKIVGEDIYYMRLNDKEVIRRGKVMEFEEAIPELGCGISYKFPIHSKYGGIRGVGGIWIANNDECEL